MGSPPGPPGAVAATELTNREPSTTLTPVFDKPTEATTVPPFALDVSGKEFTVGTLVPGSTMFTDITISADEDGIGKTFDEITLGDIDGPELNVADGIATVSGLVLVEATLMLVPSSVPDVSGGTST